MGAASATVTGMLHDRIVHSRRVRVLASQLAPLLPHSASVLDVGAGDGRLAHAILDQRPDIRMRGVDVLVRPDAAVPVETFDGHRLPYGDRTFDVAMCVDVLHHAADPRALLHEAARVGCRVLLKDHLRDGWLAASTLRLMDTVGNRRHGVALPFNYLSRAEWSRAYEALGLEIDAWTSRVPLYPWPASLVFGRGLHFIAMLRSRRHGRNR